jgi:ubiquinone/menaquinone biosynthesis C-methylase UbiE
VGNSTKYRYGVQGTAQRVFAWWYSSGSRPPEYTSARDELLAGLSGDVLEIGPGPGSNLGSLAQDVRWIGLEPNVFMHGRILREAARLGLSTRILTGTADAIPLPDESVDVVVGTLVLCSVDDQDRALAEVRRVLRPGGRYLFLEHVAAPCGTPVRRLQDVFAPISRRCRGGCRPNRETWAAIERAGFGEAAHRRFSLARAFGMRTPHIVGSAVK